MFGHCTDTYVHVHNYTSFLIKPDQPCDAGESQLRAGAAPSEQPQSESFLSSVFSTDRPPRRSLPRPNCHSHGFTSYTWLPRWPSAAAESQLPTGKPDLLCRLYW